MKCKDCGEIMAALSSQYGAYFKCSCGWKIDQAEIDRRIEASFGDTGDESVSNEPTLYDYMGAILKRYERKGKTPKMFPAGVDEQIKYWQAHQEPTKANERLEPLPPGWQWGYANRLLFTLRAFLSMKHIEQLFVIEHIDAGIPWRGDSIKFYRALIPEAMKWNAAKKADGNPDFEPGDGSAQAQYTDGVFVRAYELAGKMNNVPYNKKRREPGHVPGNSRENPDPENR